MSKPWSLEVNNKKVKTLTPHFYCGFRCVMLRSFSMQSMKDLLDHVEIGLKIAIIFKVRANVSSTRHTTFAFRKRLLPQNLAMRDSLDRSSSKFRCQSFQMIPKIGLDWLQITWWSHALIARVSSSIQTGQLHHHLNLVLSQEEYQLRPTTNSWRALRQTTRLSSWSLDLP